MSLKTPEASETFRQHNFISKAFPNFHDQTALCSLISFEVYRYIGDVEESVDVAELVSSQTKVHVKAKYIGITCGIVRY
jgi:hypothetical protein